MYMVTLLTVDESSGWGSLVFQTFRDLEERIECNLCVVLLGHL
jgi:hypothetical protein